jgi:cell division protein FtsB
MSYKKILSSKLIFICLLVVAAFLANVKYKQWQNQKTISKEKEALIKQAQELEQKNLELKNSLTYLNSADYKEKTAKSQLNLKKEGEQVYGFIDTQNNGQEETAPQNNKPNYQKWIEYFLKN